MPMNPILIGRTLYYGRGLVGKIGWCDEHHVYTVLVKDGTEYDISNDHVFHEYDAAKRAVQKLKKQNICAEIYFVRHKDDDWACAAEMSKTPVLINRLGCAVIY